MQDAEKILTDSDVLWSKEWIDSAKPHHDIILKFFDGKLRQGMKILDIGERNPLTARLEERCGVQIDNTDDDLDFTISPAIEQTMVEIQKFGVLVNSVHYDIIICSHVIEHLFNPLLFLWKCKGLMNEDANLYIITPIKPYWITPARCHFHEMNHSNFKKLIARAGLKIIDWQEYSVPIPFRFSLRNWLRRFYKEYSIVTLTK